jgi:hydroxyacylglutathione hydrolase
MNTILLTSEPPALDIETFEIGPFPNNAYLLICRAAREMVVVDPSIQSEVVLARAEQLQAEGLSLRAIWNTHGHLDHVYDNAMWKESSNAPVVMHEADDFLLEHLREQAIWLGLPPVNPVMPDARFEDGQTVAVGMHAARVLHLPGHSPGSVAFHFAQSGVMFSGDVLFRSSIGRTDLPGGDFSTLEDSLRRLAVLPPGTRVLSGHGPATTLARELRDNQFMRALNLDAR